MLERCVSIWGNEGQGMCGALWRDALRRCAPPHHWLAMACKETADTKGVAVEAEEETAAVKVTCLTLGQNKSHRGAAF